MNKKNKINIDFPNKRKSPD